MTPEELLRTRRTVRRFRAEPLGRELVEELLELAITAPSASNNQPWRFFAVDDPGLIERMARAVQQAVDAVAARLEEEFWPAFRDYGDYFVRFRAAPVVIAALYREMAMLSHMVEDPAVPRMEQTSGLVSTSLALQNLMLAAHARGVGSSCLTGPLLAAESLERLLGVPSGWHLAALVALGYPDEEPASPGRKKVGSVLRWIEPATAGTRDRSLELASPQHDRQQHEHQADQQGEHQGS